MEHDNSNCNSNTNAAKDRKEGAWIGIDLGTSNCACAVWDSTRGRPKLLQLQDIARPRKGKTGRIVPSTIVVSIDSNNNNNTNNAGTVLMGNANYRSIIGWPALKLMEDCIDDDNDLKLLLDATVMSIKRLIGLSLQNTDKDYIKSLPFNTFEEKDGSLSLSLVPLGSTNNDHIKFTTLDILTAILSSIRLSSATYLSNFIEKKNLRIPGSSHRVTNCVVGVPAHFGKKQRDIVEEACRLAGFDGHVSTIIESTAASMAYGLFVSVSKEKRVLVLDIGGGTTDITISKLAPGKEGFAVVATAGSRSLGGDDMDQALLLFVLKKIKNLSSLSSSPPSLSREERKHLLIQCRKCKESLCGTDEDPAVDIYQITWPIAAARGKKKKDCITISVTQTELSCAIEPVIKRVRDLVRETVIRKREDQLSLSIDEIVLVGGSTRVPSLQMMLHDEFPSIPDLCRSLKADGAVAEGASIQAAIKSGLVPLSEVKAALMLDALPHPIGVLLPDDDHTYVPILEKDAQLPAMGHATFTLSDIYQAGVTVIAVEDVGGRNPLQQIGEFNFLLCRLHESKIKKLKDGRRCVHIGMTMEQSGKLIVSIFDENDPEHIQKKRKYQLANNNSENRKTKEIGYSNSGEKIRMQEEEESVPIILIIACIFLILLYIGVKLVFHDPELGKNIQPF